MSDELPPDLPPEDPPPLDTPLPEPEEWAGEEEPLYEEPILEAPPPDAPPQDAPRAPKMGAPVAPKTGGRNGRRNPKALRAIVEDTEAVLAECAARRQALEAEIRNVAKVEAKFRQDAPAYVNDPAGILRASKSGGPRYPVGIAPLDTIVAPKYDPSRVGLPTGRVIVLNGAPWQGKSVLACQLGLRLALAGLRVLHLAVDEPREDAAERIGQGLGFRHAELCAEYPRTLDELEAKLAGVDLTILPDDEEWEIPPTIEEAAARLLSVPNPLGHVLVLDSLHSVASGSETDKDNDRTRLARRMHALRRLRKQGILVIVTAEVARQAYASRDPEQRTRGIASGAESRAIEYVADLLLFLSEGDDETVKVEVAKNRIGRRKGEFLLRLNPGAAQFGPVAAEVVEAAERTRQEEALLATETAILKLLRSVPDRLSGGAIEAEKLGRRPDIRAALRIAVEKGTIQRWQMGRGGGFRYGLPTRDYDD